MVRKLLIVMACLAFLLAPALVRAQAGAHFSTVRVNIWPEYDRPSVLVIDRLTLASGSPLPVNLTLKIPARAEIWAVAVVDATGTLVTTSYSRQTEGDWTVLSILTSSLEVQVEYYDTLSKTGNDRHILYEWAGDGAVDAFIVDFLLPPGGTNLVLSPPITTSSVSGDSIDYRSDAFSLSAGQVFTLTADYQKSSDALSVAGMPVQAAQPVTESTLGRLMQNGVVTTVIEALAGLLAVGLLVGSAVWLMKRRRAGAQPAEAAAGKAGKGSEAIIYCGQCGNRAQAADVFCRTCGSRLRKAV